MQAYSLPIICIFCVCFNGPFFSKYVCLLLLPQTIENNSIELEVAFRVGLEGNTDISTFESKTYKAYLPNTVNWEAGKSYTYTAQVSTYNPIVFLAPMVESWGGSQSGGTIIIK